MMVGCRRREGVIDNKLLSVSSFCSIFQAVVYGLLCGTMVLVWSRLVARQSLGCGTGERREDGKLQVMISRTS